MGAVLERLIPGVGVRDGILGLLDKTFLALGLLPQILQVVFDTTQELVAANAQVLFDVFLDGCHQRLKVFNAAVGLWVFEDLAHLCHVLHRVGNVIGGILDALGAAQEILGVVKRCSLVGLEELNHLVKVFLGIEQAVLVLGERGQERLGIALVLKNVDHLRAHLLALVLTGIPV